MADVEGRGILVRTLGRCVAVYTPKLSYRLRGAEYTRHFQPVLAPASGIERISESPSDFVEQVGGMLGEIGI